VTFKIVKKGETTPVRLYDPARTELVFSSEIRAYKVCRRLNDDSQRQLRLKHYEVTR